PQRPAVSRRLDDPGGLPLGHEPLDPSNELVRQLSRLPPPGCRRLARAADMPRDLEHVLVAAREIDHVENVLRAGDDDARDVAVAPPSPGRVAFALAP